jgi:lysophospholipase L1-like esterase
MSSRHAGWNATAGSWCRSDVGCSFVEWVSWDPPVEFFAADGLHLSALGSQTRAEALVAALRTR